MWYFRRFQSCEGICGPFFAVGWAHVQKHQKGIHTYKERSSSKASDNNVIGIAVLRGIICKYQEITEDKNFLDIMVEEEIFWITNP